MILWNFSWDERDDIFLIRAITWVLRSGGWLREFGSNVKNSANALVIVHSRAISGRGNAEPEITWHDGSCEDDVVALADVYVHPALNFIGDDRNHICCDDCEFVAIEVKCKGVEDAGVDDSETVFLAWE